MFQLAGAVHRRVSCNGPETAKDGFVGESGLMPATQNYALTDHQRDGGKQTRAHELTMQRCCKQKDEMDAEEMVAEGFVQPASRNSRWRSRLRKLSSVHLALRARLTIARTSLVHLQASGMRKPDVDMDRRIRVHPRVPFGPCGSTPLAWPGF